jgi:hypothetical protein
MVTPEGKIRVGGEVCMAASAEGIVCGEGDADGDDSCATESGNLQTTEINNASIPQDSLPKDKTGWNFNISTRLILGLHGGTFQVQSL